MKCVAGGGGIFYEDNNNYGKHNDKMTCPLDWTGGRTGAVFSGAGGGEAAEANFLRYAAPPAAFICRLFALLPTSL